MEAVLGENAEKRRPITEIVFMGTVANVVAAMKEIFSMTLLV